MCQERHESGPSSMKHGSCFSEGVLLKLCIPHPELSVYSMYLVAAEDDRSNFMLIDRRLHALFRSDQLQYPQLQCFHSAVPPIVIYISFSLRLTDSFFFSCSVYFIHDSSIRAFVFGQVCQVLQLTDSWNVYSDH